jgi:plastocyanin
MTTQYRLIHQGRTAVTAALAFALMPAPTPPNTAPGCGSMGKTKAETMLHGVMSVAFAPPKTAADSPKPPEPAADAKTPQITIDNFSFKPGTLTVPVGATVTWTNKDDIPHTVVSTKKRFASPALDTDERFSCRFTAPGSYPYYCSVHPMMTGTVVVKDGGKG